MIVISKIDLPNRLTKGRHYQVINKTISVVPSKRTSTGIVTDRTHLIFIFDDSGYKTWYYGNNFLSLSDYRELNIDKILEDDKQF